MRQTTVPPTVAESVGTCSKLLITVWPVPFGVKVRSSLAPVVMSVVAAERVRSPVIVWPTENALS